MEKKTYSQVVSDAFAIFKNEGVSKGLASRRASEGTTFNPETIRKGIQKMEAKLARQQDNPGLARHCEERGIDINGVSLYWDKTKDYSVAVRLDKNQVTYENLRDEIIEKMDAHSPKYPNIERDFLVDGHLLVVDPADVHIGKLATAFESGEDYNSHIAVKRVHEGVEGILQKVKGFNIDQIMLVIGNDILHVDSPRNTTTSGTSQDVCQMWYDNFLMAKQLYVEVIEKLTSVADVHVVFNPSNHDYTNGFFASVAISKPKSACFAPSP